MTCKTCHGAFTSNWHSGFPGGFSQPGVFFILNIAAAATLYAAWQLGWLWIGIVAAVTLFFGVFANLTSWSDANTSHGPDGETLHGIRCPHCRRRQFAWPWSL